MSKRIQDVEEGDRLWVALDDHGKKDQFVVVKVYDFNFMTRTVRLGYRYTSDHAGVEPFESRFSWDDLEYVEVSEVEAAPLPVKVGDRVRARFHPHPVIEVKLIGKDDDGDWLMAGFDEAGILRTTWCPPDWAGLEIVVPEVVRWANTYTGATVTAWYDTREEANWLASTGVPALFLGVIEHNVTKNTVTYHPVVKS